MKYSLPVQDSRSVRNNLGLSAPAGRRAVVGIALGALFFLMLGCRTRQCTRSSTLPEGWVLIKSKGQSFQMGQAISGADVDLHLSRPPGFVTYNFVMEANQVTQVEYQKVAGKIPPNIRATSAGPLTTCRGLTPSFIAMR